MSSFGLTVVIASLLVIFPGVGEAVFVADTNATDNNTVTPLTETPSAASVSESYGESNFAPYSNQFGTFTGLAGSDGRFFDKAVAFRPEDFSQFFQLFFGVTNNTNQTWTAYMFDFKRPTISVFGANSGDFGAPQVLTDSDSTALLYSGAEVGPGEFVNFNMALQQPLDFSPIDFVQVAIVPLPAALPLMLAGLAGLGLIGGRRKRAA